MTAGRRWLWLAVSVLGAGIVFATFSPEDWQVRFGFHWLIEHALVFFAVTVLTCLAYPRPMRVAAVLVPVAVGLEGCARPDAGPHSGRRHGPGGRRRRGPCGAAHGSRDAAK